MNVGDMVTIVNPSTTMLPVGSIGRIVYVNNNLYTIVFGNITQALFNYEIEPVNKQVSIDSKVTLMYNRQKYVHNLRH